MRKIKIFLLFVSPFFLFFVFGMPFVAFVYAAEVNISIKVPPPLEIQDEPDVVVVPSEGNDVYLVPNTVGLYFYGGYWFRFHEGRWFRASIYNGPWAFIETTIVPSPVVIIPPDYILGMSPGYHRIHYNDFNRHWRNWGHNHHWNNHGWYKDHSKHHWGGRDFHKPGHHGKTDHGRDLHRKPDFHRDRNKNLNRDRLHTKDTHRDRGKDRRPHLAPKQQGSQQHWDQRKN